MPGLQIPFTIRASQDLFPFDSWFKDRIGHFTFYQNVAFVSCWHDSSQHVQSTPHRCPVSSESTRANYLSDCQNPLVNHCYVRLYWTWMPLRVRPASVNNFEVVECLRVSSWSVMLLLCNGRYVILYFTFTQLLGLMVTSEICFSITMSIDVPYISSFFQWDSLKCPFP
jgi:hypothetical protein